MRKSLCLLILIAFSFTSCQYILAFMFLQPSEANQRAPVHNIDHVVSGDTGIIVIIHKNDGIFCYKGGDINNGKRYSYADGSINRFLLNERQTAGEGVQVQIKSTKDCSDENTDSILKVMTRSGIMRYALEDATKFETEFVGKLK